MANPAPKAESAHSQAIFGTFLHTLLARFPERSRAIFSLRFGLNDGTERTLEEIGSKYSITRERVRQVVDVMLKKMRTELKVTLQEPVVNRIQGLLAEHHGILSLDAMIELTAGSDAREAKALTALVGIVPGIEVVKETDTEKKLVRLAQFDVKAWQKVVARAVAVLEAENDAVDFAKLYQLFQQANGEGMADVSEAKLRDWLVATKQIEKNVFGQYGLSHWDTIKPRGTRERAHLILKVFGRPLHFREIARMIDEHGLYKTGRKTHPQTVHNELIKDKRFVLVGRGTYALSDWGYERGTVRQVLANILKKEQAPMSREDLLKAVLKVRQVKKSTVVINLNTFFAKVGKNIYTLREEA